MKTFVGLGQGNTYDSAAKALSLVRESFSCVAAEKKAKSVFLKANWVNFRDDWLPITAIDTLRAAIDFLNSEGNFDIKVGDAAPEKRFLRQADYRVLEQEYKNVEVLDAAGGPCSFGFSAMTASGMEEVSYYDVFFGSDILFSVAKMKTHNVFANTLSLKNVAIGCAKNENKIFFHGVTRDGDGSSSDYLKVKAMINRNFVKGSEAAYPDFCLIDGTQGMEGNGPVEGSHIDFGLSLASADALSADIIATGIMGFSVEEIPYIDILREKRAPEITVFGVDPSIVSRKVKPHSLYCSSPETKGKVLSVDPGIMRESAKRLII
jgi:uncharacterized protein (DUF362 family)